MPKDPAFLFYPGDWNLGTMHLTLLEKGCYIELLVLQFAKGKFTQAQANHMLNGSFDLVWTNLSEKFNTDGIYFWNNRLKLEKEKREKFSESRRNNGSIKKNDKKNNKHMPKHMEDINENENNIKNTNTNTAEFKNFNTKPLPNDFNGLPPQYITASIERVHLQSQVLITKEITLKMWEVFKVQKLTGHEYYPNAGKVYNYFVDWIKFQKFNSNDTNKTAFGNTGKTIEFDKP